MDHADRPLAILPLSEAHRQSLSHRAVLVLVYNNEGKVYLQKRRRDKQHYPGRWDVSASGHVQAAESREGAALRELEEELGIRLEQLKLWRDLQAAPENGHEFITLFTAGEVNQIPQPNPAELEGGFFASPQELAYLAQHMRDQLTPGLIYFWEKGCIFPSSAK